MTEAHPGVASNATASFVSRRFGRCRIYQTAFSLKHGDDNDCGDNNSVNLEKEVGKLVYIAFKNIALT